jgi:hypothetical protein
MKVIDRPHKYRYRYDRSARATVHVTPETWELWQEIAKEDGIKSTELLRRMIKEIVAEYVEE